MLIVISNVLTSTIPRELAACGSFAVVDLNCNFSGEISDDITCLKIMCARR
jgi:hypothetical protein